MQKKIAIVYGGYSSEEEISLKSGQVVAKNMPSHYKTYLIRINKKGWFLERNGAEIPVNKNDFSVEVDGQKIIFDNVFIAIHGTPGEDGKLQAYFDMLGISYSSSNALACAITFNKWTCNTILKQNGFKCANSIILRNSLYSIDKITDNMSMPCFVKPNNGGSSFGISKVKKADELNNAIDKAFKEGSEVLIEEFIEGIEVTCGVLKINNEFVTLPITEIVSENEFFDYEAKYNGESQEITPARINANLANEVQKQAKEIFNLLHLKGLARIDFMIKNNIPYVIEVNTVPGLTEESIVPQQVRKINLSLEDVFVSLISNNPS